MITYSGSSICANHEYDYIYRMGQHEVLLPINYNYNKI